MLCSLWIDSPNIKDQLPGNKGKMMVRCKAVRCWQQLVYRELILNKKKAQTNDGKILLSMYIGWPWPFEGYYVSILAKKVYTNTSLNLNPILGLDECFGQEGNTIHLD